MRVPAAAVLAAASLAVLAKPFDGVQDDVLDLGGRTRSAAGIDFNNRPGWPTPTLSVSDGTFRVTGLYRVHNGLTEVKPGGTLRFGGEVVSGAGSGEPRRFTVASGALLAFDGIPWVHDNTAVSVAAGGRWEADLTLFRLCTGSAACTWDIAGEAVFANGIPGRVENPSGRLAVTVRSGGVLAFGGPVAGLGEAVTVTLEDGARLVLFRKASVPAGLIAVASGATATVEVAPGVAFDPSVIVRGPGAAVTVAREATPSLALPPRFRLISSVDRTDRSYWLSLAEKDLPAVDRLEVVYPNPDVDSASATLVETIDKRVYEVLGEDLGTDEAEAIARGGYRHAVKRGDGRIHYFRGLAYNNMIVRHRFPSGDGPWTVRVTLRKGGVELETQEVVVSRRADPVTPPRRNGDILVGVVAYTQNDHLDEVGVELLGEVLTNDVGNLIVGWNGVCNAKLMPECWPASESNAWARLLREKGIAAMSIGANEWQARIDETDAAFNGNFIGGNLGELGSFIYQGRSFTYWPMNVDLREARDLFVNNFIGGKWRDWIYPYVYSTCGAANSCYELAGGTDFIVNELWSIGAENIAYASAEARGAARKWKPAYWGGWNAHDWQSGSIPYHADEKYDSLKVAFLQEYVAGTSMIILESGAQGPQGWRITAQEPGGPRGIREDGFNSETATRYRRTVRDFYRWTKAHPRGDGAPEAKIAIALGNLDGYIGLFGDFPVWCQHGNSSHPSPTNPDVDVVTNRLWLFNSPERTQKALQDLFYPCARGCLGAYGNAWLAGSPFGQVDVAQVDGDSTLADLARYDLLAFGGWNTMTPHVRDVLERYVRQGGTLVMSRPELTTRADRDYENYADADLLMPFADEVGGLPAAGLSPEASAFSEYAIGRGRFLLFTGYRYPGADVASLAAYTNKIAALARDVRQAVRIASADASTPDVIYYGVYPDTGKAYFLNVDTRHPRTFSFEAANATGYGKPVPVTLKPCEIKVFDLAPRIKAGPCGDRPRQLPYSLHF